MSVKVNYKGEEILSVNTDTTKTLKTSGKYCEADIEVINTPDGGGAPVINPLSVTENGTYNAPSGVDGYSPVTVNVPQGITPTGNINITDTNVTDVTNYATAQVVDADLVASNIKKDVNILGVVGSFEGGGGSLLVDGIVVSGELPEGYTPMKYLQSSGTQYINTGVSPDSETGLSIMFCVLNSANNVQYGGAGEENAHFQLPRQNSGYYRWNSYDGNSGTSTSLNSFYNYSLNFMNNRSVLYFDTKRADLEAYAGTTYPFYLFAYNNAGSVTGRGTVRIYGATISQGLKITHKYVPAMRNADSVLGLYDIVEKVFLTNAGTGYFTGGALG